MSNDKSFDHGDDGKGHGKIKIWLDNWTLTKCVCDASLAYSCFLLLIPISIILYRYKRKKGDVYVKWKFFLLVAMIVFNFLLFLDYGIDLGFFPWLWYLL